MGKRTITFGQAVEIIRAGGIVVYPTETVYGLGCRIDRADSVERLKKLKGREGTKPILIAVHSVDAIGKYAVVPRRAAPFLERVLPGPVAVILEKKKAVPGALTGGSPSVGVRVPAHPVARALARACGAITSTSANPAGERPATTFREVIQGAGRLGLATVLPGKCKYRRPSTVFDVETGRVLREGAVPAEKLYRIWRARVK